MKKILFFIESLGGGGAETVFSCLLSHFNTEKFGTTVISERDDELYASVIKTHAKHKSFIKVNSSSASDVWNKIKIKLSLCLPESLVRKMFIKGNYDVEIAFCEGYATKIIGNSSKHNCKKIAWVHTDVVNYPWSEAVYGSAEKEKKCYENFDAIVCVSQTMKDAFVKKYGMAEKVHVLYNPIDFQKVIEKSNETCEFELGNGMKFILAGSFKPIKGYDRFVKVCKRLKTDGYNFSVMIMGSGPEKEKIKSAVKESKLENIIKITSFQPNPYKYIKKSDVFVCCSYAEGYSTAVSEAVALNIPVITTECSGMREIFGDKECGIICENSEDGIYFAMKKVLNQPLLLKRFSEQEKMRAKDFSLESRIKAIEDFIESV